MITGATIFGFAALLAAGIHIVLILGAPSGHMTTGGRNPGVLPPGARVMSDAQLVLLPGFIAIVLQKAGLFEFNPNLPCLAALGE